MPHPSHVGESWLNLGKCQGQQILVHLPTPDSKLIKKNVFMYGLKMLRSHFDLESCLLKTKIS